ncbi:MAG: hypothetical protein BWY85_01851 [Firmicutes bacterium ADurb.Bin506]|nr:MAG: hypothetical protein BWY85_01851 [Firmicutes bacterium ADurb.Bin506]
MSSLVSALATATVLVGATVPQFALWLSWLLAAPTNQPRSRAR